MPPGIRAQLAEISEEWVADKALPEMGFTLGGLDELKDPEVVCCVAGDDDGLVHGVTSWLPVFTAGVGWGWGNVGLSPGVRSGCRSFPTGWCRVGPWTSCAAEPLVSRGSWNS